MSWHPSYPRVPDLRCAPPGPASRELVEGDHRFSSPSYTRAYPLAVKRGEGAAIEDMDGNVFLDFTAGIAVCATGHCHPDVVKAIQDQAANLIHMSGTDFYYGPLRDLSEKLAKIAPGDGRKRVYFGNSGAEAVEAAIKLARYHTGRPHVIAFYGGFHGRTMGALSLTASKVVQRSRFAPLLPEVSHAHFANCYRCPVGSSRDECAAECIRYIEEVLFKRTVSPDQVAAIVVEPIQGEGGYVVPPPEFHQQLRELTRKHGILYVADEVQTGMGRTGKMFACEHFGVEPDILCLAKGLASGMPLGAMIASAQIMDWIPGSHASTFGGNPISCVAALETIRLLEEGLIENAARVGGFLLEQLCSLKAKHAIIGDVRGLGLMLAIDLVTDRETKTPAVAARNAVIQRCFERGLLLLGCGDSAIRFSPPLVIDENDTTTAVAILDEALSAVT